MIDLRRFSIAVLASAAFAAPAFAAPSFVYNTNPNPGDEIAFNFQGYTIENPGVPLGQSFGAETTWGMGSVLSIQDQTTGGLPIWFGQTANPQNTAMDFFIYGIADNGTQGTNPIQLFNTGCTTSIGCDGSIHVDFYLKQGTDPALLNSTHPTNRTGFSTFTGITDGTLFMKWDLVPSDLNASGDLTTTLYQDVDANALPTTGSGKLLAECVSGPGCALYGNNAETLNALTGIFNDFEGNFTLQSPSNGALTFPNLFPGRIVGQALTVAAAPEPASMALLGAGLAALGLARRRKD